MVDSRDHDQSSSRKAKKPRIPKRGPGVAELEKILREQDQQRKDNGHHIDNKVSSSSISSLVHGNTNNINVNGHGHGTSKGVYIGGSGVYLPEQSLLPISWKDEREPTADFSFPVLASNGSHDHTKMMDFFKSSSTTGRVYNHQEPPSSQKHYTSTLGHEDQDKMKATKRSRPNFPVENWRSPPTPRTPYQPIRPMVSRLGSSSSSTNNGIFNLGISRDTLDHGNPSGNGTRNLITLGSPTTPLPSTQNCEPDLFIKQFPFQENTEGSLLQRSSTETEVPVYNKSFISFLLQPEDQLQKGSSAEPTVCLKNEKCCIEKTEDFIDLDLKL